VSTTVEANASENANHPLYNLDKEYKEKRKINEGEDYENAICHPTSWTRTY
jgi:hypothetical protein